MNVLVSPEYHILPSNRTETRSAEVNTILITCLIFEFEEEPSILEGISI